MPLIAERKRRDKTKINESILTEIYKQVEEYCHWSGIMDLGFFFEEAAKHIFANDKLWHEFNRDKITEQTD